jgi:FlaA1/EpsC-like NDP-sugar epimerase
LPLGVIALEYLLSTTLSIALRLSRRVLHVRQRRVAAVAQRPPKRVLLYGAGRAGVLLRRELETNCMFEVIGYIDDDSRKMASTIARTRVLGNGQDLARLVRNLHIDEVIITMATANPAISARIAKTCRSANVACKIIPSVHELLDGSLKISHLRETRPEEVLGREHVEMPDFADSTAPTYGGKRILVTGAGGSIGSELVRQLLRLRPATVAVLDKDENSIYELEQDILLNCPGSVIEPHIADVRDLRRLRRIFSDVRPDAVFHAAAHKHVPLMERLPCEAVLNNVCGTQNVLEVAGEFGVERFVFISTDKAVRPVNIMGATKRVGELLVQKAVAEGGIRRAACVRFGNVLGSRGSVIPLFQKQIARGGPVTVTHPDVIRFFMTIQEAVQLVLCAGTLAARGEIFVLEMGRPRNILGLAREMIQRAGLEPEKDIHTVITGMRAGEKLFEELVGPSETLRGTSFDKLMVVDPSSLDEDALSTDVAMLVHAAAAGDSARVYGVLNGMNLEFTAQALEPPRTRAAVAG